jgi:hypothetical protein
MLKRYGRKCESKSRAGDNQQNTSNHAIPAMAASHTAPENDACFWLIGQLLTYL